MSYITRYILFLAFIVAGLSGVVLVGARPAHKPSQSIRAQAINETLDMVLIVGSDFRARGKHPTWAEIDAEVARRMRVTRPAFPGVSR